MSVRLQRRRLQVFHHEFHCFVCFGVFSLAFRCDHLIRYDAKPEEIKPILDRVNGLLLPGGTPTIPEGARYANSCRYSTTSSRLFEVGTAHGAPRLLSSHMEISRTRLGPISVSRNTAVAIRNALTLLPWRARCSPGNVQSPVIGEMLKPVSTTVAAEETCQRPRRQRNQQLPHPV